MKTLVAGWFSFFNYGSATAGDLLAAELVGDWLEDIGCPYDFALDPPFQGGINWRFADPKDYSHIVFVCGPFCDSKETQEFLAHFSGCRMIGLNLTMIQPVNEWNPFDVLIERDSSASVRPDMVFLTHQKLVPVVGICLVEPYGAAFEEGAYAAIQRLVESREMAIVNIDTRLDTNTTGLCSSAEIESLIARMDMVITTRLHGTVLSLKNGVPTISIDPGGDSFKIEKQTKKIGWNMTFTSTNITDNKLQEAFDYCLTEAARKKAKECSELAKQMAVEIQNEFITAFDHPDQLIRHNVCHDSVQEKYDESKNKKTNNKRIYADLQHCIPWGELPNQNKNFILKKLINTGHNFTNLMRKLGNR
ncbi:polysaccharide pyruvyl transferase family protein [Nostoc sp. DedSLP04]|uniref:polysaccharide pyruvyl transferase family protein n=1 Tax=Nostoc sp. DedSLP04 TaxID=3075401 RepID=UPI002AD5AD59|nr:polysaccharide pyruvyl transferase family protein [Nostoc sp. DedSLP04]MDZ8033141.1 polysaccharide pyruvyl transferase family protein [Nostoc sp. DedSLP04]